MCLYCEWTLHLREIRRNLVAHASWYTHEIAWRFGSLFPSFFCCCSSVARNFHNLGSAVFRCCLQYFAVFCFFFVRFFLRVPFSAYHQAPSYESLETMLLREALYLVGIHSYSCFLRVCVWHHRSFECSLQSSFIDCYCSLRPQR